MTPSQNSSSRSDDDVVSMSPPRPTVRDYIADKFIEFSSPAPDAALCGIANAHAPQRNVVFTGAPSCCFWFRYLRVSRHTD
jgi:hypothetical protein